MIALWISKGDPPNERKIAKNERKSRKRRGVSTSYPQARA
jgi:hypothetical protein